MSHSLETEWKNKTFNAHLLVWNVIVMFFLLVLFTFFRVPLHFIDYDPNIFVRLVLQMAFFHSWNHSTTCGVVLKSKFSNC